LIVVLQKVSPFGNDSECSGSVDPYKALHHSTIDGTDDRILNCDVAKRAMTRDNSQLVISFLGMCCEPVGSERIGNGLHC